MAKKPFDIPGYNSDRQLAFDAAVGNLLQHRWVELPYTAQALLAAVIITQNPGKYTYGDGTFKQSLPKTFCVVLGFAKPVQAWAVAASTVGVVEYGDGYGRAKTAKLRFDNEHLRSVMEDLALYAKDPNAVTSEDQRTIHDLVKQVCDDPRINHKGKLVAAVGYALLTEVDACHP